MKSNIFVPKKIKVGFQNRNDTYTKKLAYVIYYDQQDKLRKEASWSSWRDDKIPPKDFDNTPMSGFVLNKKVGDYVCDWNHRQAYVRVYDPRDFEFEITVENLLYILENTSSIKGKGLEGDFVYGWDGKDLVLLPIESPDYKNIENYNEIVFNNEFIKSKDLIIGAIYLTKNNQKMIYMGKFDYYTSGYKDKIDGEEFASYNKWYNHSRSFKDRNKHEFEYTNGINAGKYFYFTYEITREWSTDKFSFVAYPSISKKFIAVINDKCIENYAEIFDLLEYKDIYSPIDRNSDKYIPYTFEQFERLMNDENKYWKYVFAFNKTAYEIFKQEGGYAARPRDNSENITRCETITEKGWYGREYTVLKPIPTTPQELFEVLQPCYKEVYLKNGKLYDKEYYYE